jgi:chemotaxis protein methyltransferase CheR
MLSEPEIVLVAREMKARTGAVLTREMGAAAEIKLQPLARREGFGGVSEMIAAARIRPDGRLWGQIADHLVTVETRFFRDKELHAKLRSSLLPDAMARRGHERVRVWSAACSTGQEAYSIAMTLEALRIETGRAIAADIIATDISERLIEKARSGLYTQFEVQRGLPIRSLIAHFEKAGDLWRISDRLRAAVRFEAHNLLKHPAQLGQFDIILLCHTLAHFDAETRLDVLLRAADALAPGGVLLLGAGETLPDGVVGLELHDGVIRRPHAAQVAAA